MSYNLINQFKKDNKITPKGILFIFMLFVIVVQSAIIIYSNLFELEHHLGFDASSAYLQAVEIWRCKSLVPSTFALTTTLGLDSPTPLAALFYGITGNIFLGFGIANIIFDVVIAVIFYNLLKEFKLSAFEIALGFIFLLCPFMTPDHFIDNNLSYFAMVLGEQGSYSVKIITMLLLLWVAYSYITVIIKLYRLAQKMYRTTISNYIYQLYLQHFSLCLQQFQVEYMLLLQY